CNHCSHSVRAAGPIYSSQRTAPPAISTLSLHDALPISPRLIAHSPPDARVVVFGSSAFVSDDILELAQRLNSDLTVANVEVVHKDRKSTRLNSSHVKISYAVFCLKKKKRNNTYRSS